MDWIRDYGKGRVYTTMLGHTWKDEPSPNLDDVNFQALFARGVEWAASGKVTLPPDLGWKPLFNGKNLDGWEVRGPAVCRVMQDGVLMGGRAHPTPPAPFSTPWPIDQKHFSDWLYRQAWLYTKAEFGQFDLHVEYWIPPGANSGVSIRDRSRAHTAIGEADSERPELSSFEKTTPAHIGYEIQIIDDDKELEKVKRVNRLCELNVIEQVNNVCHTTIVQDAWDRGQSLAVHGWIYSIRNGLIKDLSVSTASKDQISQIYRVENEIDLTPTETNPN